ncbi:hypothetical protein APS_2680 [Acetobacter pasteurianus subsp. pasteurianus LMG 1262 = NBRC 106471]|nr:hypothetical protein APS_2680 [Acetobacter pasteurianus subsp. pasteurianus LMG 1262 = NBRC 106471]
MQFLTDRGFQICFTDVLHVLWREPGGMAGNDGLSLRQP